MGCRTSTERERLDPEVIISASAPPSLSRNKWDVATSDGTAQHTTLQLLRQKEPRVKIEPMNNFERFDVMRDVNSVRRRHSSDPVRWSLSQTTAAEEALSTLVSQSFAIHLKFLLNRIDVDDNLSVDDRTRLVNTVRGVAREAETDGLMFAIVGEPRAKWETLIDTWYDENVLYDYGAGVIPSDTAHFAQLVWNVSNIVGAAYYSNRDITIACCKFYPPLDMTETRALDCDAVLANIRAPLASRTASSVRD